MDPSGPRGCSNIGTAYRVIKNLEGKFRSYIDDLVDTDRTRNLLTTLKGEFSKKDEQIKMLENYRYPEKPGHKTQGRY
jgi:hypothetical protein